MISNWEIFCSFGNSSSCFSNPSEQVSKLPTMFYVTTVINIKQKVIQYSRLCNIKRKCGYKTVVFYFDVTASASNAREHTGLRVSPTRAAQYSCITILPIHICRSYGRGCGIKILLIFFLMDAIEYETGSEWVGSEFQNFAVRGKKDQENLDSSCMAF